MTAVIGGVGGAGEASGVRTRYAVDPELCIGCGLCQERAPENLEVLPGDWHSTVIKQPDSGDEERACAEAAEFCPTGALQTVGPGADPAPGAPE